MSPRSPLRIVSRGSQLALWQAEAVAAALRAGNPGLEVEIQVVRTTGDRILDVPLARIGDRGLFTRELDEAMLRGDADLAVHSLKDIPTRLPEGLHVACVTAREDPRDVLLLPDGRAGSLAGLPAGARVGTSSLRRRAQLRAAHPELRVVDMRGNLNTRLRKLDEGECDALLLAAAGVRRLGWEERIAEFLDADAWLPAVGQGALGVVTRAGDAAVEPLLAPLHDAAAAAATVAERAFLRALEGGCQVPIGALARVEGDAVLLRGLVADAEGAVVLRGERTGSDPADVGLALAGDLLARGAGGILAGLRGAAAPGGAP